MARCLELARMGSEMAHPNPLVGCVIVKDDRIIGEGWHREYGKEHAEVNAINSVADQQDLKDATLYVNLEPCSHQGKTPPCSDLIIEKKIPKVVVGTKDPNPMVGGRGLERLKIAGIDVRLGVKEKESKDLNRVFFTPYEKERPYIILKWAQSKNGFLSGERKEPIRFTDPLSDRWVHRLRAAHDGILVGAETVRTDNPKLTTRYWPGPSPRPLVLNKSTSLPVEHNLEDPIMIGLDQQKAPEVYFDPSNPKEALKELVKRGISSLVVEGGKRTLNLFIDLGIWDEALIFTSEKEISGNVQAPKLEFEPQKRLYVRNTELLLITNKLPN